jgi:hypothetical protein
MTPGSTRTGHVPRPVVRWLQTLLRERLHADLLLRINQDGAWCLHLPDDERHIHIRCDFEQFLGDPRSLPCGHWLPQSETGLLPPGAVGLPTPGVDQAPQTLMTQKEQACHVHYDILGLAWWMLSRYEEVGRTDLDPHGRFPAEASHAFRHGYLERPIVDEWLEVLRRVMQRVWPRLPLREHHYALSLSHDVDTPARYGAITRTRLMRNMVMDLLRTPHRHRPALLKAPALWKNSNRRIDVRDPFNTFDWIMDRSEEIGLRNAFYFLCGRSDRRRDGHYEPDHPGIVDLMQRIHARGHEIGLHPSFNTYMNPQRLKAEADRLRAICAAAGIQQPAFGVRMHYLRWRTPDTAHALVDADLVYDTTLGYAMHPGFRCGTCHEYSAIDPVMGEPLKIRLRPLIVMESTIIGGLRPRYVAAAQARMVRLMEACHRVGGTFTLLWHNTLLEHAHQRQVYEHVLQRHLELKRRCNKRAAA